MKAQPSYIRTIKPNQNRSSSEFDTKAVLHQIKYLGLQENIRVRRAGFAYRNTFEKMVERFYLLSPNTSYAGEYTWTGDAKSACMQILKDTGIPKDQWQMGVTKAFIKNPETVGVHPGHLQFFNSHISISSLLWKPCEIDIGTTWLAAFNVLGRTTCDTKTSVPVVFKGSGGIIKKVLLMRKSVTTATNCWLNERNGGGLVFLGIGDSWVII